MSAENALRILIESSPLWQQQVPVHVRTVYTVLGRKQKNWQTILSSTDDIYDARRAMDAANGSGIFDRLIIAEARRVNNAPAGNFKTIECALPQQKIIISEENEFAQLLGRLQQSTANYNPAESELPRHYETPVVEAPKESCTLALSIAFVLAAAHANPMLLAIVGLLSFLDVIYLSETAPISATATKRFNALRHWGYALLNGALLLPLALKFLM